MKCVEWERVSDFVCFTQNIDTVCYSFQIVCEFHSKKKFIFLLRRKWLLCHRNYNLFSSSSKKSTQSNEILMFLFPNWNTKPVTNLVNIFICLLFYFLHFAISTTTTKIIMWKNLTGKMPLIFIICFGFVW